MEIKMKVAICLLFMGLIVHDVQNYEGKCHDHNPLPA